MDDAKVRNRQWLILATLWLAGIIIFLPLLKNGFIGDDYTALSIYEAYKSKPFLETVLFGGNDFFRPLNMALIMARGALFGGTPLPYVIANVILHLVITTLGFFTVRRVTKSLTAPTAAALLFLVSFSHYEGITWISSSVELFAVLFILLSLYGHIRFRQEKGKGWLVLSLASMILAFMTKETSAALPFLILSYDLVMVERKERGKGFFWPYAGFGFLFALYLLVQTGWAMKFVGGDSPYRPGWHILTNVFDYWVWLIMPNPRHPYVAGVLGVLPGPLLIAYWVLAGVAALTLPLVVVLASLKKLSRVQLWCFLATIISLVVFLPFSVKISARYAYLPSIFFAAFAGLIFSRVWDHFKQKGRRVLLWIAGICAGLYLSANAAGTLLVEREFVKTSGLTQKLAREVVQTVDLAEHDVIFIDGLPSHVHLHEPVDWMTGKDLVVLASNDAYRGTPRDLETAREKYAESGSSLYYFRFAGDSLSLVSREPLESK